MQRYAEQLILFSKSNGGKEKDVLKEGGEGAGTQQVPPSSAPEDLTHSRRISA